VERGILVVVVVAVFISVVLLVSGFVGMFLSWELVPVLIWLFLFLLWVFLMLEIASDFFCDWAILLLEKPVGILLVNKLVACVYYQIVDAVVLNPNEDQRGKEQFASELFVSLNFFGNLFFSMAVRSIHLIWLKLFQNRFEGVKSVFAPDKEHHSNSKTEEQDPLKTILIHFH